VDEARERLAAWLDDVGGEDAILSREVRIVLVAAGFDREITTTVLWLTDVFGLDIRCVRLTPYKVDERLLLHIEQVIPLPEASELTVRLRRRESQVRAVREDNRDWTQYTITTPTGRTEPLRKRHAVLAMVVGLYAAGVPAERMAAVLRKKFLPVDGEHVGPDLADAFVSTYSGARNNLGRWFLDSPLHETGRTWLLSKMWGRTTETVLQQLADLAPSACFAFEAGEAE
jgi:hypothetical protein